MSKPKKIRKTGSCQSFREIHLQNKTASCGVHLDLTLGALEESRYIKKHSYLIKTLANETRLNIFEIEELVLLYYKFQKEANNREAEMTREQFREVLHNGFDLTDDNLNGIIIYVLDKTPNQNVCLEAWIRAMSLFLRGSFDDKLKYIFNVYDIHGSGIIPRRTIMHLLEGSMHGEGEGDDVVRDLVDAISNKMDKDRDGKISYEDFRKTALENPLMMEAFGQCFPSRLAVHAFRATFTHYSGTYY